MTHWEMGSRWGSVRVGGAGQVTEGRCEAIWWVEGENDGQVLRFSLGDI